MAAIEKILILDDNEANVLYFQTLLSQMGKGFKVFTASAGAQAEAIVNTEKVNMVICAWEMNPMPGTVFVQRLRRVRQNRFVPCLIFSKRMQDEDIALTKELGMENIIKMPFDKPAIIDLINKIIDIEENLPPLEKRLRKIEYNIEESRFTEALSLINEQVLNKTPNGKGHVYAGEIWLGTRNFEKAEVSLKKALGIDPSNVQASRLLARVYSSTGKHSEALVILESMVAKSPKNIKTMLSLSSAYMSANEHDKAKKVMNQVQALDADNLDLKDEQGKMAFKEGNISLAAQLLAETTNGDELARSFNEMGIAKISGKEYDQGIQLYLNAVNLLAEKAKTYLLKYNLGLAYYKQARLPEAFKYFCESYIADNTYEKAYSSLAKVSKELKEQGKTLDSTMVESVKKARALFKESQQNPSKPGSDD